MNIDLSIRLFKRPGILGTHHTLLFEYTSFTPLPDTLCIIVLYSPSSSSLRSKTEVDGDKGMRFRSLGVPSDMISCPQASRWLLSVHDLARRFLWRSKTV